MLLMKAKLNFRERKFKAFRSQIVYDPRQYLRIGRGYAVQQEYPAAVSRIGDFFKSRRRVGLVVYVPVGIGKAPQKSFVAKSEIGRAHV